jgi:hypothetical protein
VSAIYQVKNKVLLKHIMLLNSIGGYEYVAARRTLYTLSKKRAERSREIRFLGCGIGDIPPRGLKNVT